MSFTFKVQLAYILNMFKFRSTCGKTLEMWMCIFIGMTCEKVLENSGRICVLVNRVSAFSDNSHFIWLLAWLVNPRYSSLPRHICVCSNTHKAKQWFIQLSELSIITFSERMCIIWHNQLLWPRLPHWNLMFWHDVAVSLGEWRVK